MIFTILSNKILVKDKESSQKQLEVQQTMIHTFTELWDKSEGPHLDKYTALPIFRSILHFLAGDVARFQTRPEQNQLLTTICANAPSDPKMGRLLAQSFDVLVSPKECLDKENHAIRKRLSGEWLYFQAVRPYLQDCFPSPSPDGDIDETRAVNRAVAVFAILKHLRYEQYASDIGTIVRVAIRSLATLAVDDGEMDACLGVLLHVLERDADVLREHLAGLITGVAAVYDAARNAPANSTTLTAENVKEVKARRKEASLCRKRALEFFQRLPGAYEARYLVPYRRQLLRPLSTACGDGVREIRRTALMARQAWDALA